MVGPVEVCELNAVHVGSTLDWSRFASVSAPPTVPHEAAQPDCGDSGRS